MTQRIEMRKDIWKRRRGGGVIILVFDLIWGGKEVWDRSSSANRDILGADVYQFHSLRQYNRRLRTGNPSLNPTQVLFFEPILPSEPGRVPHHDDLAYYLAVFHQFPRVPEGGVCNASNPHRPISNKSIKKKI